MAGEAGTSSAIIIRVADITVGHQWQPIEFKGVSNTGYVLYFAKASGEGARWVTGGAVPPGASFKLHLIWKRQVSPGAKELFDLALDAFLLLGSLGLRSTRGLGCFEAKEKTFCETAFQSLLSRIRQRSPAFKAGVGEFQGRRDELIESLGAQLRGLRSGFSAGQPAHPKPSPLGSSNPRQTSAVYLRPVKVGPESYRIVVFEAPAEKVLAIPARKGAPRLAKGIPSPQAAGRPMGQRRY